MYLLQPLPLWAAAEAVFALAQFTVYPHIATGLWETPPSAPPYLVGADLFSGTGRFCWQACPGGDWLRLPGYGGPVVAGHAFAHGHITGALGRLQEILLVLLRSL
ncbi:hypothetical protein [Desulfovibrio sp.]|uniref:hypothetical protein n=1 Tax=Desulfovibrio sp. TaxID=885 RepID=UPI003D0B963D